MKKTLIGLLALALASWFAMSNYGPQSSENEGAGLAINGEEAAWREPEIVNAHVEDISSDFELAPGRLYDLSYENDPELIAFAESIGRTHACVIEIVKNHVDQKTC